MKLLKILPILFVLLFALNITKVSAVEAMQNKCKSKSVVKEVKIEKQNSIKSFFKRTYIKIKEKIVKIKRRIVTKIKRHFSKKKSKKNRTRGNLKHRNKNLYNILVFLGVLFLALALVFTLFYFTIISLKLSILLGIFLLVATATIGLIYFNKRFRIGPRFR